MNKAQKTLLDWKIHDKYHKTVDGKDLYTSDLMLLFYGDRFIKDRKNANWFESIIFILTGYHK